MRLASVLIALAVLITGLTPSSARAQSDDHEPLSPALETSESISERAGEPIFAPPSMTDEAPRRRVYCRVRQRYNFYNDPHPVQYWSPNLPYYDPVHGYNSFRPLPPKSRHYRGPANPHNTGWGISY